MLPGALEADLRQTSEEVAVGELRGIPVTRRTTPKAPCK